MTSSYGSPYPADQPAVPGRPPISKRDIVATVVLYTVALALGCLAVFGTFFYLSCNPAGEGEGIPDCNRELVPWAATGAWGGIGLALISSLTMIVAAGVRRTRMWIWPAMALVVIIASFAGGVLALRV